MKKSLIIAFTALTFMACNQENPLLTEQNTPFGVPAFNQVQNKHYLPAFKAAIAASQAEIDAIVNNPEAPTFDNTLAALDRSGLLLERVAGVFYNVLEADGSDEMDAIANEVAPLLSEFQDGIVPNCLSRSASACSSALSFSS